MVKVLNNIILWARVPSTTMKGSAYLNSSLLPSTIDIQPLAIFLSFVISNATLAKFLIDRCPVCGSHIFGVIFWVSNNIKKCLKTCLRLLVSVIPIPIPQK